RGSRDRPGGPAGHSRRGTLVWSFVRELAHCYYQSPVLSPAAMTTTSLTVLAERYAAAKSAQDVAGALAVCADEFVLDAPAFGTCSQGRAETAAQLAMFFAAFPDYGVTVDGSLAGEGTVACWGTATMTLA